MLTQKLQGSQIAQVKLLTAQEAAEWDNVSAKTVYRWIACERNFVFSLGENKTIISPIESQKIILCFKKRYLPFVH